MNFISNFKAMTIPETIHYGRQKSYYLLKYKAFQARIGVLGGGGGVQPGAVVGGWVLATSTRPPN